MPTHDNTPGGRYSGASGNGVQYIRHPPLSRLVKNCVKRFSLFGDDIKRSTLSFSLSRATAASTLLAAPAPVFSSVWLLFRTHFHEQVLLGGSFLQYVVYTMADTHTNFRVY